MKMEVEKSNEETLKTPAQTTAGLLRKLAYLESQANLGSWEYDPSNGRFFWSDQLYSLLSAEKTAGAPDIQEFAEFFHPQDQLPFLSAFNTLKRGEIPSSKILRSNPDRGPLKYFLAGYAIEKETSGKTILFMGTIQDITLRKQEEERRLASENTLKTFVENAPSAIAMFDANMCYLAASRRYFIDYDIPKQEIIGRSHYELFPGISEHWKEIHRRCLAGSIEKAMEDPFPRKDGTLDYVNWEIRPWYKSDQTIGGVILFSEVVTEQKQIKEELQIREEKFRTIFEQALDGILIIDNECQILDANSHARKILGYTKTEIEKIKFHQLALPDQQEKLKSALLELKINGNLKSEYDLVQKNGTCLIVEITCKKFKEDRLQIFIRDLSEQKRAQEEAKVSESAFRMLFENAVMGVSQALPNGKFLKVNRAYAQMYGYDSPEELMANVANVTELYANPQQRHTVLKILDKNGVMQPTELDLRKKDGSIITALVTARVVKDATGKAIYYEAEHVDITAKKRDEAMIIRLNRLYITLSQINQDTARFHTKEMLYQNICTDIVNEGKFRMAWFGEIDPADGLVLPVCFAGNEDGYLREIKISTSTPSLSVGPTGRAIIENRCAICQDIATDPRMASWKEKALAHHFLSSASVPIRQNDHVIGALTVYSSELNSFTPDEESLLDQISQNISFALDSIQAEKERAEVEHSLRESETLFSAVFHISPTPMAMINAITNKYIEVNDAFSKSLGYSQQEIVGRDFKEMKLWKNIEDREKLIQRLNSDNLFNDAEIEIYKKDQTIGTYLASAQFFDQNGRKLIIVMAKEITERINYERELQVRNMLLLAQQDTSIDGILVVGKNNQIISCNRRFSEMWSVPQKLIDQKTDNLVLPYVAAQVNDPQSFVSQVSEIYARQNESSLDEINLKDGRYFDRYSAPVFDHDGNYYARVWYFHDITEIKQAEREIRHQSEDLQLINSLNEAANRGEDMQAILEGLAFESKRIFSAQDAALFMLSADGNYLELQTSTVVASKKMTEKLEQLLGLKIPKIIIPVTEGHYMHDILAKSEGTLLNTSAEIEEWIKCFTETITLNPVTAKLIQQFIPQIRKLLRVDSVILVPLISSGKLIGLLDTTSKTPLTAEDLQRIQNISAQVTAAILRKDAENRVRVQLKRINTLNEIERAINASLDLRLTMDILVKRIRAQLKIDAASILMLNPLNHTLESVSSDGFLSGRSHLSAIHLGHGLAGNVALERKIIHLPDLPNADVKYDYDKEIKEEGFIEFVGVPLISKGKLLGVLDIFHRSRFNPDEDWINYLEMLSGVAAIAIDNAQSFEELQQSNVELSTAYDATIAGWSHAMDLRDKETEGHTQRVTDLTVQLAEAMGISGNELSQIRRGALLHDIGKLGVPDQILLKPGPLTDEEWEIMRKHPQYAMGMLSQIEYLRPAIDIPYCHHERWDGTGYPRGLKGKEIPLHARLFSIIDNWDALTSDRPYRPAWEKSKVIEYIRENSGKAFDPEIVEVFLTRIVPELK
jgi:PAS domain S-box